MILRIKVDTSQNPGLFKKLEIEDQAIYAEVSSVNIRASSRQYLLQGCLFNCGIYLNYPSLAWVQVYEDRTVLYAQWGRTEQIEIPVQVKEVTEFPGLGSVER